MEVYVLGQILLEKVALASFWTSAVVHLRSVHMVVLHHWVVGA
jgi:hypothetical protein